MSSGKKKEATRQEDITRQERQRSIDERERLEAEQRRISEEERGRLLQAAEPTGFETERLAGLQRDLPGQQDLLRQLSLGERQIGGQDISQLFGALQERLLGDLEVNPFESTQEQEFALLSQQVGAAAAQRGIVGSGLELENLGRAGIDLAIRQAQGRLQARQQATANVAAGAQAIESAGRGRVGDFSTFLSDLQRFEDARRTRQQSIQQTAATDPARFQAAGAAQGSRQVATTERDIFGLESGILQGQIEARREQDAAVGQALGTAAGVATSFIPGVGPILAPIVSSGVGAAAGGGTGGGFTPTGGFTGARQRSARRSRSIPDLSGVRG